MRIELTTSGGFTGQGAGSVLIDGTNVTLDGRLTTELTPDEEARLRRLPIVRANPPSTASPDAILYKLVVDGHRWTWNDHSVPSDCARWAAVLFAIRERALAQPSASM